MPDPIRIILVDDHELIRESWKILLETDKRFLVIGQCSNGPEAVEEAKAQQPDIILMDINMAPMNGFETTRAVLEALPTVKVIGVSANNNPRYASRLLTLGGKGFVTKTSAFEELKTAIQKVNEGEIYVCHELRSKLGNED